MFLGRKEPDEFFQVWLQISALNFSGFFYEKKTIANVYLRVSWKIKITFTIHTNWSYNPLNCSQNELLIVQIFHQWIVMYSRKVEKNKIIWIKKRI